MRYQIQFGDSGLHAFPGIQTAVSEALEAHFGDAEAVMRAYVRCVAAVGSDTRLHPPAGAPETDVFASKVWFQGESVALKGALAELFPGLEDEVSRELLGNCFLILRSEADSTEFNLPLPF